MWKCLPTSNSSRQVHFEVAYPLEAPRVDLDRTGVFQGLVFGRLDPEISRFEERIVLPTSVFLAVPQFRQNALDCFDGPRRLYEAISTLGSSAVCIP